MTIAFSILCFCFAVLGVKTEKKLFNPVSVMCCLWSVIVLFSSLHLFKLYTPKDTTYYWVMTGVSMFVIGYYAAKKFFSKRKFVLRKSRKPKPSYSYELNYKLMYAALIICIFFMLKDYLLVFNKVGWSFDLGKIQKYLQNTEKVFVRSSIEVLIRFFIVNPLIWIIPPIAIIDFWIGKRDKLLLGLSAAVIALKVMTTGGRASFIQLGFFFICVFSLVNKERFKEFSHRVRNRKRKKDKIMFISLGAAGVALLLLLTFSRAGQNAMKTIYYDFAMQPIMMQTWAEAAENIKGGMGAASLDGFLYPLDFILRNTIHVSLPQHYQEIHQLIMDVDTKWKSIGYGVVANAYVSAFWFFYIDGGIFGIILGSFLYGGFTQSIYKRLRLNLNQKNLAIYCLVIIGVFYTFGRFQFSQDTYVLGFIYLCTVFYRKKRIHRTLAG